MEMVGSEGNDSLGVNGVSEMGITPSVSGMTVGDSSVFSFGSRFSMGDYNLLVFRFDLESFTERDFGTRF
jgi:hypothetical protein